MTAFAKIKTQKIGSSTFVAQKAVEKILHGNIIVVGKKCFDLHKKNSAKNSYKKLSIETCNDINLQL